MAIGLAVLVSGSGSTLGNLIEQIASGSLNARIELVIGSRGELGAEARARAAGIPYRVLAGKAFESIEAHSAAIFQACQAAGAELVVCAGWLAMLRVPTAWTNRVINVHPSLLPAFGGKGMFGRHVHQAVIDHGCRVSGCTVHFVDDHYDNGPIILQRTCAVNEADTPESLAALVQAQERIALPQAIAMIAAGKLRVVGRRVLGVVTQ